MDQPGRQFLAETEDLIEQIFVDLDGLRESRDAGRQRQLVDGVFRRLHRIKGSAATFGLDGLSEIAHEFESLLSAIRAGRVVANDNVLDTCESAASALSESLSLVASGVIEPSRRSLFERIHALAPAAEQNAAAQQLNVDAILNRLPPAVWQSLTDDEKQRLARCISQGTHLCVVSTTFDITSFEEPFYSLKEMLAKHGEVIASSPVVDAERSDKINFRILFAGANLENVSTEVRDFPGVSVQRVDSAEVSAPLTREAHGAASQVLPREIAPPVSNFIRTDLDDLDRLISSTHELFRITSQALDLAVSARGVHARDELTLLNDEIRRSFLSVEDELINLRMVSLGPVLQRAARAGRAAARVSIKEIDFEIEGTTLRLDKLLCDAIADPLVHLVRNAVDHGIESAAARVETGKRQRGRVRIEAASIGGQTRVRVIDDGRGIDIARVTQAANELGIVDSNRVVDMDRSLRLIFRPGLSTLATASTISGRGVGLDVVETAVEQVGGEIRVSSEPGRGSIFEISLPVTFGLLRTTIVRVGEQHYCIDADQVITTSQIYTADIVTDDNGETLQSARGPIQLLRLSELLDESMVAITLTHPLCVITCELPEGRSATSPGLASERRDNQPLDGRKRIGIVADQLEGTEEVLVRNLGHHAGRWFGIAGATEFQDGTVALVLDLPRLLSRQSGR